MSLWIFFRVFSSDIQVKHVLVHTRDSNPIFLKDTNEALVMHSCSPGVLDQPDIFGSLFPDILAAATSPAIAALFHFRPEFVLLQADNNDSMVQVISCTLC